MMETRNPKYNALGTIDCEIEHPVFGWIPFTASPDDVEETGRDLYVQLLTAGGIAPYTPDPSNQIMTAPEDLFGGPTLGDLYGNV